MTEEAFEHHFGKNFKRMQRSNVRWARIPQDQLAETLRNLQNDPLVQYAELDGLARVTYMPDDPIVLAGQAWHLDKIEAQRTWDFTSGSDRTIIAVLDTGVAANHPDLSGRILAGLDLVNGNPDPADDFGHGTAVAGVIVASANNQIGSAGVAYSASVLPVKVADASGFAAYSAIAEGILYAVDNGARIINISIAGTLPSATLQAAIDLARSRGAVVVAASGNNGNAIPLYPASCNGVLSVGATTSNDSIASFSNFGSTLQLTAPGDGIWTTQNDALRPYAAWRGTSFSAPIVSGVAALALALRPSMAAQDLEELLRMSADDLGTPGWDSQFGWGRVNAAKLVSILLGSPGVGDPVIPQDTQDSEPPSLSIIGGPRNGARIEQDSVIFAGVVKDDSGVCRVEAALNGETYVTEAVTAWSLAVPLAPGTNWISFRAYDSAGNSSPEARRAVFRVVKAILRIEAFEGGRVLPDLNGASLEVGRSYTVRAVANAGNIFSSWGDEAAGAPVLRFIMEPGLVLRPSFIPNPFPAIKGAVSGLVSQRDGVAPESSGYFAITLSGSGRFSGVLRMAGQRAGFSGRFLSDGTADLAIRRKGKPPIQARLAVDLSSGSITGELTDGAWVAEADGSRNVFSGFANPAPQAGARGFLLNTGEEDNAEPAGGGMGRIARNGRTLVKGYLRDGRRFATRSTLDSAGDYPLFLSFNKGTEMLIGWVNFPANRYQSATGQVLWVGSGTNSFVTALRVTGN